MWTDRPSVAARVASWPAVIAFLCCFVALNLPASPPPGYYEVWGDEFNGTSLDPAKWWTWAGPSESAVNTADAVTLGGGYLTITTYTTNGTTYSAIISSDARFRSEYGYYESSIEFSDSPGEWSAFWIQSPTEGAVIGDPSDSGAEIDIGEHRAVNSGNATDVSGQVQTSVHWDGYGANEQTVSTGLIGSGLGTGFHTYGFLWTRTNYSFAFDGATQWNTTSGHSDRTEIFMFSQEVQSNGWAGIVPPSGYGNFLTSTTKMVIDYIRYYAPTTTVFWTGTSSGVWADSGNWISNMIPTSASDVVFGYLTIGNVNITLAQNTSVNSLAFQESGPIVIGGNALTINGGGVDMVSTLNNGAVTAPLVLGANQNWKIGSGYWFTVTGPMSGPGNLTLTGSGIVALTGTNTCSGFTTVSNGQLLVDGVVTNAVTVSGGALGGTGTIAGMVQVNAGGTLSPGTGLGTLTISNILALRPGSFTSVDVNKTTGASDKVAGLTSVSYNGTLVINNQSGAFAAGDAFKLFDARSYSGAFGRIVPLTPGTNLAWNTSTLATDGTLRVVSMVASNVTSVLAGNQLTLSWPANNLGWVLQAQTNMPLGVGLTMNWVTVAGSAATNRLLAAINPGVGSVFYRLVCPATTTAVLAKGDLIVLQVGNGSIGSSGAPGYLNDYLTTGGPLQTQVALPTNGSNALIFGGSSYDGGLSVSADGQSMVVPGYNVALGSFSGTIDTSSTTGASAVPRGVGLVNAAGTCVVQATTTKFSGSTIRSAIADGAGNYWAGGGASGVVYLGNNAASATLSTVSSATRNFNFVNGSIYFTETGSGDGVMAFTGAPKSAATPVMVVSTAGTGTGTPSPKGFAFNPGLTIAYVADNRTAANGGGIQRFNWNGSSWVYAYTLGYTLSSSKEVYDLVADFSGTNPVIYAVTGEASANKLVTVTDTGAASAFTVLETAPAGDAFRGLVFAP